MSHFWNYMRFVRSYFIVETFAFQKICACEREMMAPWSVTFRLSATLSFIYLVSTSSSTREKECVLLFNKWINFSHTHLTFLKICFTYIVVLDDNWSLMIRTYILPFLPMLFSVAWSYGCLSVSFKYLLRVLLDKRLW